MIQRLNGTRGRCDELTKVPVFLPTKVPFGMLGFGKEHQNRTRDRFPDEESHSYGSCPAVFVRARFKTSFKLKPSEVDVGTARTRSSLASA